MKQMLIWFGIVYGNLNALVGSVVLGTLWVDGAQGKNACLKFFVDIGTCRVWIVLALVVVFGTSTILSLRRFMQVRREHRSQGGS
jgi:uncharacterized membrane protein YdbT with pleckstrin-like domain